MTEKLGELVHVSYLYLTSDDQCQMFYVYALFYLAVDGLWFVLQYYTIILPWLLFLTLVGVG